MYNNTAEIAKIGGSANAEVPIFREVKNISFFPQLKVDHYEATWGSEGIFRYCFVKRIIKNKSENSRNFRSSCNTTDGVTVMTISLLKMATYEAEDIFIHSYFS